jgi:hypothetical protein
LVWTCGWRVPGRPTGLVDSFAEVQCAREEQSGQKAAWLELCQIIRHLGSGIVSECHTYEAARTL